MVAPTDTSMVPMRVSKAVALGDGDDLSNRALRERFYQSVAGISANRARAHWARLVFSSRVSPPRELGAQDSLSALSHDPKAITYVYASQLPKKAHVLLTLPGD